MMGMGVSQSHRLLCNLASNLKREALLREVLQRNSLVSRERKKRKTTRSTACDGWEVEQGEHGGDDSPMDDVDEDAELAAMMQETWHAKE